MEINTNFALTSSRLMSETSKAINRSLERLSTGKRINQASDDLAGFTVAIGLDSKIRGLSQANLNINQGVGMLQTADSALSVQMDILQKMRELAVQGSSGTLTATDRTSINLQLNSLRDEFSRITTTTEFNGTKLLDGSFGTKNFQVGSDYGQDLDVDIGSLQASAVFEREVGTGSFGTSTTSSVGTDEDAMQLVDMNNDGVLDLVVANDTEDLVSVAIGNGDGTFGARTTIAIESNPIYMNVADVNGDGINDVIVADGNTTESIAVLLGNGDGTLQARTTYVVSLTGSSSQQVVGDFDGDGDIDIVIGDSSTNQLSILLNNGDGTFQPELTQATTSGVNPGRLTVGDFDGDGVDDIFAITTTTGVGQVLLGASGGVFTLGATADYSGGTSSINAVAGDFNNDGIDDLLINTNAANAISYLEGAGGGTFAAGVTFTAAGNHHAMRVADINDDGNLDIIGVNSTGSVSSEYYISLGNGNGGFSQSSTGSISVNSTQLDSAFGIGDVDGDGALDLVGVDASNDDLEVLLQSTQTQSAVSEINVNSLREANNLIGIIDTAIENINNERVNIANSITQLESIYDYNSILTESFVEAKAGIEDTDIAAETSKLVYQQILQQSQIAALSQANVNSQVILQLLNF